MSNEYFVPKPCVRIDLRLIQPMKAPVPFSLS